jgi:CRISPR-associated protein Csb2
VLPARFVRYRSGPRPAGAPPPRSLFEHDWIVLARVTGPRLPIIAAAGLSRQLRRALMSVAAEPIPELLSGHARDGRASESAHLAIVPLPAVLGRYADGALMGIALVLPRGIHDDERRAVLAAVGKLERRGGAVADRPEISKRDTDEGVDTRKRDADRLGASPREAKDRIVTLTLDAAEPLTLQRVWGEHERQALRPMRWTRASRCWASATPVALDRNPGDLHDPDPVARARAFDAARASVIESVQRIGLPAPVEVDVVRSCVLPGTAKPRSYPRFPAGAHKPQRVLVHVRLVFGERVRGPLLIGAGRYQGLGLCAPIDEQDKELS